MHGSLALKVHSCTDPKDACWCPRDKVMHSSLVSSAEGKTAGYLRYLALSGHADNAHCDYSQVWQHLHLLHSHTERAATCRPECSGLPA